MSNRNRRRSQRESRSQAEDNSRRSRNPERRNEDPEEELPSAPRQLRTWDDLIPERQRQAPPHVQIPVRNYENEEVNYNRPWAGIVEEELSQASSQDGEVAAGRGLWTDPFSWGTDDDTEEEEFHLDSLVESDEEINDDLNYGIPIRWPDVVDVKLQEEGRSVSSNSGHHQAENTSAHPLTTDTTQAELSLQTPSLLPVIAHNSHVKNKDATEDKSYNPEHTSKSDKIQEQESSSLAPNLQNQQQSQKSPDIELIVPIRILCADEVKKEQRTTADNLTKIPAVQENLWENKEKQDHPPTSSETFFSNLEDFPDLASANPQGKTSKTRAESMPANVKFLQAFERLWKLATSENEEEQTKSDPFLKSPVKSSTDKYKKQQKKKASPHKTLQSERKKKQKVMWSNLIMDDEQFPVLGSARPQKQDTNVQEQLIVQSVPLAQTPIVLPSNDAIATASETVANRMVQAETPQKKNPQVHWATFKTMRDDKSLGKDYPILLMPPISSKKDISFWKNPYTARPSAGQCPTQTFHRDKFRRGGIIRVRTERQGKRALKKKKGLKKQPQHHRHQDKRNRCNDNKLRRSRTQSSVQPSASKTKKDYTPAQSKQPKTYRPLENVSDSTLGVSKSDNYGPPLQSPKPQRTTGSTHGKEPQKLKILKRPPLNVSNHDVTCKRSDYECKLMQSENTNKVSELDSQIKVTTIHCAMQTIGTQTDLIRDGTIIEDELIPEPVAPSPREDGSIAPVSQLEYLFEKREYFQARCRKLIQKHYPNEDISSKLHNESYDDMYSRFMAKEAKRLCIMIKAHIDSILSIPIGKTTETEDQRSPSSESRQRSQITKQEKINVTKVPEETNEQTIVSDIEEVTSEQVLYPEYSWKNDEEANKILDEQELQQTGWSAPVSHKRSKSKKNKIKGTQTKVACSKKKQSPKPSVSRNLEAQDEKASVTERISQVPEENISTSLLLISTSSLNDLAMQDEEVNSKDEITDNKTSWEVCSSRRNKSRKKSKSKKKKAQKVNLFASKAAHMNKEKVLIEAAPPTSMSNGYINPNDEKKFQIKQEIAPIKMELAEKMNWKTAVPVENSAMKVDVSLHQKLKRKNTEDISLLMDPDERYFHKKIRRVEFLHIKKNTQEELLPNIVHSVQNQERKSRKDLKRRRDLKAARDLKRRAKNKDPHFKQ